MNLTVHYYVVTLNHLLIDQVNDLHKYYVILRQPLKAGIFKINNKKIFPLTHLSR